MHVHLHHIYPPFCLLTNVHAPSYISNTLSSGITSLSSLPTVTSSELHPSLILSVQRPSRQRGMQQQPSSPLPEKQKDDDDDNNNNNSSSNNNFDQYLDDYLSSLLPRQAEQSVATFTSTPVTTDTPSLPGHHLVRQSPIHKKSRANTKQQRQQQLARHTSDFRHNVQEQRPGISSPKLEFEHSHSSAGSHQLQHGIPIAISGASESHGPDITLQDNIPITPATAAEESLSLNDKAAIPFASGRDLQTQVIRVDTNTHVPSRPTQRSSASLQESSLIVHQPASHTARCRAKVNSKFAELMTILPPPPPNVSVRHKAQVLQYTCSVLESIAARQRALEAELTLSSADRMRTWISENVACRQSLVDALDPVLRLIMSRSNWKCGDIWLPALSDDPMSSIGTPQDQIPYLHFSLGIVQDGKPRSDPLHQFTRACRNVVLRPPAGVPGRVFVTGRPEWLARIADPPTFERAALARDVGVVACLALPIVARDRVIAIIAVYDTRSREYDNQVVDVAESIIRAVNETIASKQISAIPASPVEYPSASSSFR